MPQTKHDAAPRRIGVSEETNTDAKMRQCAVSRERLPQEQLIRFVRSPDGEAVPDTACKLPGRGAWVQASRERVEQAIKGGVFSRAFKAETRPMDGLADAIETQLTKRCSGLIGMAKKSGTAVVGFDQVRAYIRNAKPGWLLEASNGAEDGRNKVHFLAKAIYDDVKVAGALSSAELGMAFGRDSVIHGLLEAGRLADSFGVSYRQLIGFRRAPEAGWFSDKRETSMVGRVQPKEG